MKFPPSREENRNTYIPHPHLNRSKNPKIIFREITQHINVKLHVLIWTKLTTTLNTQPTIGSEHQ